MGETIGVGMTYQTLRMRNGDAAEYERSTFSQSMNIVSMADAVGRCHDSIKEACFDSKMPSAAKPQPKWREMKKGFEDEDENEDGDDADAQSIMLNWSAVFDRLCL